jgi:hypothetical protein
MGEMKMTTKEVLKELLSRLKRSKPLIPEQLLAQLTVEFRLKQMRNQMVVRRNVDLLNFYIILNSHNQNQKRFDINEFIKGMKKVPEILHKRLSKLHQEPPKANVLEMLRIIGNQLVHPYVQVKIDYDRMDRIAEENKIKEHVGIVAISKIFKENQERQKRRRELLFQPFKRIYPPGDTLNWEAIKKEKGYL